MKPETPKVIDLRHPFIVYCDDCLRPVRSTCELTDYEMSRKSENYCPTCADTRTRKPLACLPLLP